MPKYMHAYLLAVKIHLDVFMVPLKSCKGQLLIGNGCQIKLLLSLLLLYSYYIALSL